MVRRRRFHDENFVQSTIGSRTLTAHVIVTFLRSLWTSFIFGVARSVGHCSSSSCKNFGPGNHLTLISSTGIPFVMSSATFALVGQWDQSNGSLLLWISATLDDTNGL